MNQILKSEHPEMFKELAEFEIARIKDEHRATGIVT
jgi:hypothetical protein